MLEGPTGISKIKNVQVLCDLHFLQLNIINISSEATIDDLIRRFISDKGNTFSGITYKEGVFA